MFKLTNSFRARGLAMLLAAGLGLVSAVAFAAAPVIQSIADQTIQVGETLSFPVVATDADGDVLRLVARRTTNWMSFDGATFSATPGNNDVGTYRVVFLAFDRGGRDGETVNITVLSGDSGSNNAPVFTTLNDQTVDEGATLSVPVSASDADGDTVTITAAGLVSWMSFSRGILSAAPGVNDAGSYPVTFTASDGTSSTQSTMVVTVNDVTSGNRAPQLAPLADRSINEGSSLSLTVSATDPDGDIVSIQAAGLQSWMSFNGSTFSANPGAGTTGSYTVTFSASDGSLTDQESFKLTVGQGGQAVNFPRGVYASSVDRQALEQPFAEGALVRGPWSRYEPARGSYDFTDLERQIDTVRAAGKKWTLAISSGPETPSFHGSERVSFVWRNENRSMPAPWDTDYLNGLREFMNALANVYGNDPDLEMIYVPLISPNGIEGSWTSATTPSWDSLGYTTQRHADAVLEAVNIVSAAFPNKAVAVEFHEVNRSTALAEAVIAELDSSRVGIAAWWLGQGTYQPAMQEVFKRFNGVKIGQVIASQSREPDPDKGYRLTGYDKQPWGLEGVYRMAQDMGISYVEPWPIDVKSYPDILDGWLF